MIFFLLVFIFLFNVRADSATVTRVQFTRVAIGTTSGEEPPVTPPASGTLQFLGDDLTFNANILSFNP